MATHRRKAMPSHSATATGRERNVGNTDAVQASAEMPAATIPLERRREARMDYRQMCSYEVLEAIEEKSVVIRQGEVSALNRSTEGILLLMGRVPHEKQLIEVHTPGSGWDRTVNIFETRWARPARVESPGNLHLVGCQRIFGPLSLSVVQQPSE